MTRKPKLYRANIWYLKPGKNFTSEDAAENYLIAGGGGTIRVRSKGGWVEFKKVMPENFKCAGEEFFIQQDSVIDPNEPMRPLDEVELSDMTTHEPNALGQHRDDPRYGKGKE